MDSTKSFIRVYNITPDEAEGFEYENFDQSEELGFESTGEDISLIVDEQHHGNLAWGVRGADDDAYEYSAQNKTIHFVLDTKWEPPLDWLKAASSQVSYFENKTIIMTTIQKDETSVTGIVVKDGDVLQNKQIFNMPIEEVSKYYDDDEEGYDVDSLDNQIWDSIGAFLNVCEKFYIKGEQ